MGSVKLRESVLGIVGDAARNCPLPRHFFSMPNNFKERIEAGSFYEINHAKLPIDAPAVLYTLRAVMVTATTEQNVTIRYPSIQSLQAFFAKADRLAIRSKLYPATDEKYVLDPKLAVQVLGHQISSREFVEHRHSKSFWLINCSKPEQLGLPASMYGAADNIAKNGTCFSTLQSCGMKWGFRQTQIVQSCTVKQPDDADEAMSALSHGDDQNIVKKEEIHEVEVKLEETPDIKVKEIIQYSRKRKHGKSVHSQYRKTKRNIKRESLENLTKVEVNGKDRVDRWSLIRYEVAVKNMVEVLKANKASYSNPISRGTLRIEARKKIGDTGLLDHLLKHLAGKVVPSGGDERLRRRCAPDGTMEYWLESADLVNIRKEAGIQDPYWTPPPGWKKGDCISSHNCICCQQVRLLKEELNSLRRKETDPKFKEDKQHTVTVVLPENASTPGRFNKDSYEALAKKKSLMVEQLHKMSKALVQLEAEMKKVKSQKGAEGARKPLMITYSKNLSGEETSEESSERDDEAFGRGRPLRACRRVRKVVTVTPPTASPHSTTTS
ncbi:protein DYAD-like isoform X2 [Silene latifolia]|uniref:protein DYAD-like isoform X2 n=1 Tax=Silene latifolia TaxID=37657 RepID=UPI003D76FB3D